jgi:hypothetical protein
MPEVTPQQIDEYHTRKAIEAAVGRIICSGEPAPFRKPKPRKVRSDKLVTPELTREPDAPIVRS